MSEPFTWERGPFERCPACGCEKFGLLSAGGDLITRRCAECRYSESQRLPTVDKAVVYLDQLVFSQLFNVEAGNRIAEGHEDYFRELHRKIRRGLLLQQVICPYSDIHQVETIVYRDAARLREACEALGGNVSFKSTRDIQLQQTWDHLGAFLDRREPTVDLNVDTVLEGRRNQWLPDMRIVARSDYTRFAQGLREARERTHKAFQALCDHWRAEKPSFDQILERELGAFGRSRDDALNFALRRYAAAASGGDIAALFEAIHEPILIENAFILEEFGRRGVPEPQRFDAMREFWAWDRNRDQPYHRVSAHLFAALARRVGQGGQKNVSRGFMNDVAAIATYGPYVDAMFVDRECATLLRELGDAVKLKGRIFSLAAPEEFLSYLDGLEAGATDDIRARAHEIYRGS